MAPCVGALRTRFGLLSNRPRASALWLEEGLAGPLAACLAWHDPAAPLGTAKRILERLGRNTQLIAVLDGAFKLALAAATAARRVAEEVSRGDVNSQRPSTWGPAPEARKEEREG